MQRINLKLDTDKTVKIDIEMDNKELKPIYGGSVFIQNMFITILNGYSNITMEVFAEIRDQLRPELEFVSAKLFDPSVKEEVEEKEEAKRLLEDGFLESLSHYFYR